MTKKLAVEWADHNIHVNAIASGQFPTPLAERAMNDEAYMETLLGRTPLKRMGQFPEIVGPIIK